MYILKKLNREKRVGTAAESAALQEKGWKLIQEKKSFEKAEIEEIANGLSEKLKEEIKASEGEQEPDTDKEPDAGEESQTKEDNEPDADAEPEKKTSARSRKKD